MVIVAREAVAVNGDLMNGPTIGTGPWISTSFEKGQRFTAKRNPDYFVKGLPYIDTFDSARLADLATAATAFRGNQLDVLSTGVNAQTVADLTKAMPNLSVTWILLDRSPAEISFNLATQEVFRDVRVRQAISKAIDRKAAIETVFFGRASQTTGLSFPAPDWQLPDAELNPLLARDVEGAKQLLRQAGKDTGLTFEMITINAAGGVYASMAELFQANLRDVGINVTLQVLDNATAVSRQAQHQFQAYLAALNGGAPNATLYGHHYTGGGTNFAGYSNPALDKLIDQQGVLARDPNGRKKILQDIQRMILSEAAYIPVLAYQSPVVAQSYVKDLYPPTTLTAHLDTWTTAWIDK
jgi:ABC-type transport system substrate-binding protein